LDDFSLQFSTLIIDQMPMKTFILTAAIIKISLMTSAESVWRVNHQSSQANRGLSEITAVGK
jgi:hypothetical protein